MRRARAVALLAFALALPPLCGGCVLGRAFTRAAGSLFTAPKPVKRPASATVEGARLSIVWVGHATVVVQMDDKLILTDPLFTSTAGQLSKRLYEPGIDPDVLPKIDAAVVSHMHFDHLSLGSLAMLEPKIRTLLVPRGGTAYVTDFAFPTIELRPWQTWEKDGLRVTAVPVDHVGFRYGVDDAWMKTSFTGYVFEYHGLKVYFGGDSAYDQADFVETGRRFPNIDLALLPIAPIEPREIMRRFHMDPVEAVQCFVDLGAKRMVPVHYGTFVNSTDERGDALAALDAAWRRHAMGNRQLWKLAIGEQHVFLKEGDDPAKLPAALPAANAKPDATSETKPAAKPDEPKKSVPKEDDLDSD